MVPAAAHMVECRERQRREKISAYIIIICSTGDLPILSSSYRITIDGICQCFYPPPFPFSPRLLACLPLYKVPICLLDMCACKVSYVWALTELRKGSRGNVTFIKLLMHLSSFPLPLNFLCWRGRRRWM